MEVTGADSADECEVCWGESVSGERVGSASLGAARRASHGSLCGCAAAVGGHECTADGCSASWWERCIC